MEKGDDNIEHYTLLCAFLQHSSQKFLNIITMTQRFRRLNLEICMQLSLS